MDNKEDDKSAPASMAASAPEPDGLGGSASGESRAPGAEEFAKKAALLRDHQAMVRVQLDLDAERERVLMELDKLKHVPGLDDTLRGEEDDEVKTAPSQARLRGYVAPKVYRLQDVELVGEDEDGSFVIRGESAKGPVILCVEGWLATKYQIVPVLMDERDVVVESEPPADAVPAATPPSEDETPKPKVRKAKKV